MTRIDICNQSHYPYRMHRRVHLLLIEPNGCHVELIRESLLKSPTRFIITVAGTPHAARQLLSKKNHFDLVVTEGVWPHESRDWLTRLKVHLGNNIPIVILSSTSDEVAAVTFMKMGVDDYLVKRHDTLKNLPHLFLKHLHKKRKKDISPGLSDRMGRGMNSIAQNLKLLGELINHPAMSLKKGEEYLKQKHGLEKEIETLKGMLKNWIGG